MYRHNYEKEIIDTLISNDGKIIGFNNFRKLGRGKGFQPNYLKKNLDRMMAEQTIKIESDGNKQVFLLIKFDFDQSLKEFTKDLDEIENRLFKSTVKKDIQLMNTREYIVEIYHQHNRLLTAWLHAECVEKNKKRMKRIETAEKYLHGKMKTAMSKLDEYERLQIINSLPYL